MYKFIGGGEEDMRQPFVYFFSQGAFGLAVKGEYSPQRHTFAITLIRYWDDPYAVLKTPEGISVGSTREKIERAYGSPLKEQEECLVYSGIIFKCGPTGNVIYIDLIPNIGKE